MLQLSSPARSIAVGSLFAVALADDLAFELGKRKQDVERQPSHRCGRIELLGH